jgi:hypothetical protein
VWYNSIVYAHVGAATRTSSGAATAGLPVGHVIDGQLIVTVTGLAGVGSRLTPYWQSSADGVSWGDLVRGATMTATGVRIISMAGGIGQWARARWTQSATGLKFNIVFALKA